MTTALSALSLLAATLTVGPATAQPATGTTASAVTGDPVLNRPVFNNPMITSSTERPSPEQSAVMDQLIRLIQATQPGGEVNLAMHEFSNGDRSSDVVAALIAASRERGVHVRVILDSQEPENGHEGSNEPVLRELRAGLGTDETNDSWVIECEYPRPAEVKRGCIADNYLHNKFAVFSNVRVGGVVHPAVVFQSSSNLSDYYLYWSFNDAYTFTAPSGTPEATVYSAYRKYFQDLRLHRASPPDPNYYWGTAGLKHQAVFYPHPQDKPETYNDPVIRNLDQVKCRYQDAGGVTRQTDIRMVLTKWSTPRIALAKKVRTLRGQGCWVEIIYPLPSKDQKPEEFPFHPNVVTELEQNTGNPAYPQISLKPCRVPFGAGSVVPHTKITMIDGQQDGGTTPRVYTGSMNFTNLQNSDDVQLRITDQETHKQYLSWYYDLRAACSATP
ncbi:phospholipase D-like domain-containing protein [Streptomyces sp. 71268]|uniref:phospholipase D-like domain-containing protein n=1 Tax=Streptomyces sp. 71268 TaxID=3002640 RepID=UPI0023F6D314|nr:phospholipase D-like domain-containing protein [Streptomyces sp. 71268]WEV27709.1 phospholipase D-like domain-containing protein [Streptomyces sp. 71268]